MSTTKTLGIIPARGGSKGIPRKNILNLDGKPLISYTITASLNAKRIDKTIVSTEDEEIATVAETYGAEIPFMRPNSLAEDETPTEPVVTHALKNIDESFDEFALLQPTSPLRTDSHIDGSLEKYISTEATSLVSVYPDHSYRWRMEESGAKQINYSGERKRRQDKTTEFVENGAIYITKIESFQQNPSFTAGKTALYQMNKLDSIDIDELVDLKLAELVLNEQRQ